MQAIAFLPKSDIVDGFLYLTEYVKTNCEQFTRVLKYFERTYVGALVENSQTIRKAPRFAHDSWSLYERVLSNKPRTTNNIESWHNSIRDSDRVDMQFVKLIEFFRIEQSNTENYLIKVKAGHEHKKNVNKEKEERYYNLCFKYKKSEMVKFLEGIQLNFEA